MELVSLLNSGGLWIKNFAVKFSLNETVDFLVLKSSYIYSPASTDPSSASP